MAGSILGNRVLRKEDPKFLTTGGVYVDDMVEPLLDGAAYVTYVRSSLAHGRILSIDTSEAAQAPGVLAVFTGADLDLQPAPSPYNPTVARTYLEWLCDLPWNKRTEDRIDLEVRDDGRGLPDGFSFESATGLGLSIVRALVVSDLGGSISASSPMGSGTVVSLSVPVRGG